MPQIIPVRDLRDTTKLSNMCHDSREPIFVTKNGYGDLVVLSMETYEKMFARLKMFDAIMVGKEQADNGNFLDGPNTLNDIEVKYGL